MSVRDELNYGGGEGAWRRSGPQSWRGKGARSAVVTTTSKHPSPALPTRAFGQVIDSINIKALLIEEDAAKIENVQYVASYNWIDGEEPVILVPGSPPAWTPPTEDRLLKPDCQDVYRDINAARYEAFPMEPALRSIIALAPDFDLKSIDVIGCGSTMGNLLRFASSQAKPFRFDVDRVGDTVILVRRESSPKELIEDLRGYGHTFPENYTTWDAEVRQSCSHQRVIHYQFGGLQFLLRSETDGYLKQADAAVPSNTAFPENLCSLPGVFGSMSMGTVPSSEGRNLQLRMQGTKVPQDRIFDIKTRSISSTFDMGDIIPRLWINQTPNFLLAYHQRGLFDRPGIKDVRDQVKNWEKDNVALLGSFHGVIKRIVDTVRDSDCEQVEVSWDGDGPLMITKQIGEGRKALPADLHSYWETV